MSSSYRTFKLHFAPGAGATQTVYSGPATPRRRPNQDIGLVFLYASQGLGGNLALTTRAEIFADEREPWCAPGISRLFSIAGWGLGSGPGGTSDCASGTLGVKRFGSGFTVDGGQCGDQSLSAEEPGNGTHRCSGDSGAPWVVRPGARWLAFAVHHGTSWHPSRVARAGNRVKRQFIDPETEDVVDTEDQVKGYAVGKNNFITVEDQELDAIKVESTRTIDIDSFVPRKEIDPAYIDAPYIAPEDKVSQEAFAVIRDAMLDREVVGIGRVVGIEGGWGSGKSSLLNLTVADLRERQGP
jgi:hypothetical protein